MPVNGGNHEVLDLLLDDLDFKARQGRAREGTQSESACQRRAARQPFRADCTLRFLPMQSWTVSELRARTRNLSRSGVGLLARRMFTVGDAIELELKLPKRPILFIGGLVAFCRYAGRGYYEIGVALKAAQSTPIFSENPMSAMESVEWLRPETNEV